MKKLVTLLSVLVFGLFVLGIVYAETPAAAPAANDEKPVKVDEKKVEEKAVAPVKAEVEKPAAQAEKAGKEFGKKRWGNQTACPVDGKPVNKEIFTEFEGKKIYFSSEENKATFLKDPAKYVKEMEEKGVVLERARKFKDEMKGEFKGKLKEKGLDKDSLKGDKEKMKEAIKNKKAESQSDLKSLEEKAATKVNEVTTNPTPAPETK